MRRDARADAGPPGLTHGSRWVPRSGRLRPGNAPSGSPTPRPLAVGRPGHQRSLWVTSPFVKGPPVRKLTISALLLAPSLALASGYALPNPHPRDLARLRVRRRRPERRGGGVRPPGRARANPGPVRPARRRRRPHRRRLDRSHPGRHRAALRLHPAPLPRAARARDREPRGPVHRVPDDCRFVRRQGRGARQPGVGRRDRAAALRRLDREVAGRLGGALPDHLGRPGGLQRDAHRRGSR